MEAELAGGGHVGQSGSREQRRGAGEIAPSSGDEQSDESGEERRRAEEEFGTYRNPLTEWQPSALSGHGRVTRQHLELNLVEGGERARAARNSRERRKRLRRNRP